MSNEQTSKIDFLAVEKANEILGEIFKPFQNDKTVNQKFIERMTPVEKLVHQKLADEIFNLLWKDGLRLAGELSGSERQELISLSVKELELRMGVLQRIIPLEELTKQVRSDLTDMAGTFEALGAKTLSTICRATAIKLDIKTVEALSFCLVQDGMHWDRGVWNSDVQYKYRAIQRENRHELKRLFCLMSVINSKNRGGDRSKWPESEIARMTQASIQHEDIRAGILLRVVSVEEAAQRVPENFVTMNLADAFAAAGAKNLSAICSAAKNVQQPKVLRRV